MSENPLKIVFAGLDAAGKTTIYKRTMEEIDVESLQEMKPTKYIQRSSYDFLGLDMSVWDLGGQESYRQKYLNKPEIFNQTKALIFVVDLQDPERFEEAYNYFVDILKILVNVTPTPKVYVLFHKFDPDKMNILRPDFYRATKLFRQADKILQNAKFVGFATSIYSESITLAIHRIILENFPEVRLKRVSKKKQPPKPQTTSTKALPVKETLSNAQTVSSTTPKTEPLASQSLSKPVIKETKKEPPIETKVVEEEPEPKQDKLKETVIYEKPPELDDLAPTIINQLTRILDEKMQQTPEIIAISVLNYEGKVLVSVAKDDVESKKISILSDVISSLNVKVFFDELGDIEYRGLGHLSLGEFDIYFAKVSDTNAMAVFANDVSTFMLENAQDMVKAVRDVLKLSKSGGTEVKEKPLTKESLLSDLRSKLKGLGGYKEI